VRARRLYRYSGLALLRPYLRAIGKKNAVFIWIPKTAGTSMFSVLDKYGCSHLKYLDMVKYHFPQKGIVSFSHMSYRELVRNGYISKKFDASAFKFCFARNPYDRSVSLFFFLKKEGKVPQNMSFLSFCRQLRDKGFEEIGLYHVRGLSQCNPQVRWIEGVDMDFIGKIESIDEDFRKVLDVLGLPSASVPRLNKTRHKDYEQYYCHESREIVKELYKEDFRFFDYKIQEL